MKKAFTLIELLVVITIIAILAGLLIPPAIKVAKEKRANRLEQTTQSQTVYHAGDTVWIKRNGEILKGELTHSPER